MTPTPEIRVTVIVSPGCHLCDDACAAVAAVCGDLSIGWASRQLATLDEADQAQWRDYTPVVLIDGEVHDVFRVTPDRLRAALKTLAECDESGPITPS